MELFRTVDGSNNNPDNPALGQVDSQLLRKAPSDYGDGISTLAGADRPMAREISNGVFAQDALVGNEDGSSNLLWMWGQFIDHDLSLTENGLTADQANMTVPTGDLMFDPLGTGESEISFTRSAFDPETGTGPDNPRQQINQITAYIDASMVYGSDQERLDALRTDDGKLVMSDGDLMGFNTDGLPNAPSTSSSLFLAGDVRANENVGLTSLHTIFAREHNRLVDELSAAHPEWDGDRLFQEARILVEAQIQIITYDEFLPSLLGEDAIAAWSGYDATVDPQIANEFSTAAFRLGHTMLSTEVKRMAEDGSESEYGDLQLRDAFFRPDRLINEGGIEDVLRGAAAAEAEAIDTMIIDDVRNFLFGPPGAGGFDLASLNIQRGRDHGLADYNTVREAYGLARVESFAEITSDTEVQAQLEALYGSVDNIDLFVGGLAEDAVEGSKLGALFQAIVVDQFIRTRDGDSFWHENILTDEQMAMVQGVTLADVIERNSDIVHMQDDVFTAYDRLAGTEGDDSLIVVEGKTLMMGGEGDDFLLGGADVQQLEGDAGSDRLHGRHGDDLLYGGEGDDTLYGGYGDDMLNGDEGDDTLNGSRGADRLDGGAGDDTLFGGRDADVFVFSTGADVVLDFDRDSDQLDFMGSELISGFDDLQIEADEAGLLISDRDGNSMQLLGVQSVDGITMAFGGETIVARGTPENIISGGDGDLLIGTTGNDFFADTEGYQFMLGREGNDTAIFSGNRADYQIEQGRDGLFHVSDADGTDILWFIETIRFDDQDVDLNTFSDF